MIVAKATASVCGRACGWADRVPNPRRSRALSFCIVSARSQLFTQPHTAPSLLAAASLHMHDGMTADTNQLEVPSDAGWATWAEAPKNSTDEEVARTHTTKRVRSPGPKGKRPNFFFALQVSQSAAVTAVIKSVHDSLVQHSPDLQAALVEPETAHLTLMVTALDSEEEVQHAEAAMEGFSEQLAAHEAWAKPLALSLEGLSHFRHQVLYLDIKQDTEHERLLGFAKALREHMQASGVKSSDDREFTGHVTIAKLSKARNKRRKSGAKLKKIAEEGYAEQLSIRAGEVLVTELQLCQMQVGDSSAENPVDATTFAFDFLELQQVLTSGNSQSKL